LRFLWAGARKDIVRRLSDVSVLAIWIGIPTMLGVLITAMVGGSGGAQPMARLLVVDRDDSTLSGLFASALSQGPLTGVIDAEQVEEDDGRARLDAGEATALLIVPEGFGAALLKEEPTELLLITNPAQRILPRIVIETLDIFGEATFYFHRVLNPELREVLAGLADGRAPSLETAQLSLAIGEIAQRIGPILAKPQVELVVTTGDEEADDAPPLALLFMPGLIVLALFFVAQGTSADMWIERRLGTLARNLATPHGPASFLAGKLLGAAVLMVGIGGAGLVMVMAYHGVPWGGLPLALALSVAAGCVLTLLMQLVQLHASSERAGSILTTALLFPLLMLGGSFFPSEAMPGWLAGIGAMTPNGLAVERLKDVFLGRVDVIQMTRTFGAFALATAALFAYEARRLRHGFGPR